MKIKTILTTTLLAALCCQAAPEVDVQFRAISDRYVAEDDEEPGVTLALTLTPSEGYAFPRDVGGPDPRNHITITDSTGRDLQVQPQSVRYIGERNGEGTLRLVTDLPSAGEAVTVSGSLFVNVTKADPVETSPALEDGKTYSLTVGKVEFKIEPLDWEEVDEETDEEGREDSSHLHVFIITFKDAPAISNIAFTDAKGEDMPDGMFIEGGLEKGSHHVIMGYDDRVMEGPAHIRVHTCSGAETVEVPLHSTYGLGRAMSGDISPAAASRELPGAPAEVAATLVYVTSSVRTQMPVAAQFQLTPVEGLKIMSGEVKPVLKDAEGKPVEAECLVSGKWGEMLLGVRSLPADGRLHLDGAVDIRVSGGEKTHAPIKVDPAAESADFTVDGVQLKVSRATPGDLMFEDPEAFDRKIYLGLSYEPSPALVRVELCDAEGNVYTEVDVTKDEENQRRGFRAHSSAMSLPLGTTEAYLRVTTLQGVRTITLPLKGVLTIGGFVPENPAGKE